MNAIANFGFYYIITPYVVKKSFDEFISYLGSLYKSNQSQSNEQTLEIVKLKIEIENLKSYIYNTPDIRKEASPYYPSAPPNQISLPPTFL